MLVFNYVLCYGSLAESGAVFMNKHELKGDKGENIAHCLCFVFTSCHVKPLICLSLSWNRQ